MLFSWRRQQQQQRTNNTPTTNNQQPQQEHEHEQTTTHIQIYSITFKTTSKRIQETKITTIQ